MSERTLSHAEAKAFYDRFATLQDLQRFYEDVVVDRLLAHADLGTAHAVVDFGCGTGRVGERLLGRLLPPEATYLGIDVSATMVERTRARLDPWGPRARVVLGEGVPRIPLAEGGCDRVISTFVLDLLDAADIRVFLAQAHRALASDGLLCLASLTAGDVPSARALTRVWTGLHRVHPALVGGCRPIDVRAHLGASWRVVHREVVRPFGLCSEVLVAAPVSPFEDGEGLG